MFFSTEFLARSSSDLLRSSSSGVFCPWPGHGLRPPRRYGVPRPGFLSLVGFGVVFLFLGAGFLTRHRFFVRAQAGPRPAPPMRDLVEPRRRGLYRWRIGGGLRFQNCTGVAQVGSTTHRRSRAFHHLPQRGPPGVFPNHQATAEPEPNALAAPEPDKIAVREGMPNNIICTRAFPASACCPSKLLPLVLELDDVALFHNPLPASAR